MTKIFDSGTSEYIHAAERYGKNPAGNVIFSNAKSSATTAGQPGIHKNLLIQSPNQSFSGCDMVCSVNMNLSTGQTISKVIGQLQTISYSVHNDKSPVRGIGSINARGYTTGPRTIAGSLVFAVFNRHWMFDLMSEYIDSGHVVQKHFLIDELPPFDITISAMNEHGYKSRLAIYKVFLVNEGQVMSINDIYTENTYQYVALDIDYLDDIDLRNLPIKEVVPISSVTVSPISHKSPSINNDLIIKNPELHLFNEDVYQSSSVDLPAPECLCGDHDCNNPSHKSTYVPHIRLDDIVPKKESPVFDENGSFIAGPTVISNSPSVSTDDGEGEADELQLQNCVSITAKDGSPITVSETSTQIIGTGTVMAANDSDSSRAAAKKIIIEQINNYCNKRHLGTLSLLDQSPSPTEGSQMLTIKIVGEKMTSGPIISEPNLPHVTVNPDNIGADMVIYREDAEYVDAQKFDTKTFYALIPAKLGSRRALQEIETINNKAKSYCFERQLLDFSPQGQYIKQQPVARFSSDDPEFQYYDNNKCDSYFKVICTVKGRVENTSGYNYSIAELNNTDSVDYQIMRLQALNAAINLQTSEAISTFSDEGEIVTLKVKIPITNGISTTAKIDYMRTISEWFQPFSTIAANKIININNSGQIEDNFLIGCIEICR